MNNPIGQLEAQAIEKSRVINDSLETFFTNKIEKWNTELKPLFVTMAKSIDESNSTKITDLHSHALGYRQNIRSEIALMLANRSKDMVVLKKAKQDKFLFYCDSFPIKTNMGEKSQLIEAHTVEIVRKIELIDTYIDWLRETAKTLETMSYAIKDVIEYYKYLAVK